MNLLETSDEDEASVCKVSSEEDEACMLVVNRNFVPKLTNRKTSKCEAKWISTGTYVGMAEVTKIKGNSMKSMGINRDGRILLHVEEMGYLLQREALIVSNEGSVMTIMDIFSRIMMGIHGCSWDSFKVYLELKNLGYIIGRHNIIWSNSRKNSKVVEDSSQQMQNDLVGHFDNLKLSDDGLSCSSSSADTCFKALPDQQETFNQPENITLHHSQTTASLMFDVFPPNCKFRKTDPGTPDFSLYISSHAVPGKDVLEVLKVENNGIPVRVATVDAGRVTFFQFDEIQLPVLP